LSYISVGTLIWSHHIQIMIEKATRRLVNPNTDFFIKKALLKSFNFEYPFPKLNFEQ